MASAWGKQECALLNIPISASGAKNSICITVQREKLRHEAASTCLTKLRNVSGQLGSKFPGLPLAVP